MREYRVFIETSHLEIWEKTISAPNQATAIYKFTTEMAQKFFDWERGEVITKVWAKEA